MYKKTIEYTDYNGIERKEDFHFNLTQAEIMEMELGKEGGMTEYIKKIVKAKNTVELAKMFKEIILMSYGEKSADGRKFIKSEELRDDFVQTEAYSKLFMELVQDDKAAAEFINGITPSGIDTSTVDVEEILNK